MIEDYIDGRVLTKARERRGDVEMMEGQRGGVEFRTAQVPLDYYLKRKIITKSEYRAGDKLYRDFILSAQSPGMTMNLDPIKSGICSFTQAQLDARERWRQAIIALSGPIAQAMLINVCCYGFWLRDIEYRYYRTSQQAMARFHEALEELISYYDENKY